MRDMLYSLARQSASGDLYLEIAEAYLSEHEWGRALRAMENCERKGRLSDPDKAGDLRNEIYKKLGIRQAK